MKPRFLLLAAALLAVPSPARADDAPEAAWVDTLLEASGLDFQVRQIPNLIQSSVAQSESQWGELAPESRASMALAIRWAFAPEKILADIREQFIQSLTADSAAPAIEWLTSPTGRLITRAEKEGSTLQAQRDMAGGLEERSEGDPRVVQLTRLSEAIQAARHQMDFMFQVQRAMLLGLNPSSAAGIEALDARFEANREVLEAVVQDQIVSSFLSIYRDIRAEDLDRYIAFAESEGGQRYHNTTVQAMTAALSKAGTRMGQRLAQMAAEAAEAPPPAAEALP